MFIIKRSLRRNKRLSDGSLLRFWFVKKLITPLTGGLQKFHSPCVIAYKSIKPNYVLTRLSCNHLVNYLSGTIFPWFIHWMHLNSCSAGNRFSERRPCLRQKRTYRHLRMKRSSFPLYTHSHTHTHIHTHTLAHTHTYTYTHRPRSTVLQSFTGKWYSP